MVSRYLSDDGFYYFQIARNIAQGVGSSFDGITKTNGYHPLWMLICVMIFKFVSFSDINLPIHYILSIGSLLDTLTGVLLYILLRKSTSFLAALTALIIYLVNPITALMANSGVELPLQMFMIALYVYLLVNAFTFLEEKKILDLASLLGVGVSAGLLMLTRTDNIFYIIPSIGYLMLKCQKNLKRRYILILVIPTFMLIPWVLWNIKTFGTIMQDSGFAIISAIWARYSFSPLELFVEYMRMMIGVISYWIPVFSGGLYAFFLLIGLGVGIFSSNFHLIRKITKTEWALIQSVSLMFSSFLAELLFHVVFRMSVRPWYVTPFALFISVFGGLLSHKFLVILKNSKDILGKINPVIVAMVIVFGLSLLISVVIPNARYVKIGFWPHGKEMYDMAKIVQEKTPRDAKIGAFNAGILGYYSSRTIINLDGLVNHEVAKYFYPGGLIEYLQRHQIDYIVDDPITIEFYDTFLKCTEQSLYCVDMEIIEELKVFHSFWSTPGIKLLKLNIYKRKQN
jgi:hypothetical protein